jgi:hypothetical protein
LQIPQVLATNIYPVGSLRETHLSLTCFGSPPLQSLWALFWVWQSWISVICFGFPPPFQEQDLCLPLILRYHIQTYTY